MTNEQRRELHRDRAKCAMRPARPGDLVPQLIAIANSLREMGADNAADRVWGAIDEIEHPAEDGLS